MDVTLPLIVLGIILLIHLTFVNVNIGLGFYSVILKWKSLSNPEVTKPARKVFKFLVATEVVSGVYGTMITVILAGIWPTLVNIVTIILFIPLIVSIIGIIIRLTSIAAYWYTWDKVRPRTHLAIGLTMALSGLTIPAGFRYIFAFINNPVGLTSLNPISGNVIEALTNPVYPPLLIHTFFGALSIGFLAASAGLACSSKADKTVERWSGYASLLGGLMIIPQGLTGFWFWSTLSFHSPYLFASLNRSFLPLQYSSTNVSYLFLGMVLISIVILTFGIVHYHKPSRTWIAYMLAPLSIAALILGEMAHDIGRLPYMVIVGDTGIPVETFINRLMLIEPALILSGLLVIIFFTAIFIALLYLYLVKGIIEES
ncbi:MAG: cytochrome ubiquinol oxidase subunit I [Nitrososphaerota archaeon]